MAKFLSSFVACSCAVEVYEELGQALVYEHPQPRQFELPGPNGMLFDLDDSTDRAQRHENVHAEQRARCAPAWLPRWLPRWLRAWWGTPRFAEAYAEQHKACGFLGNPFELEARRGEDPTLILHDDDRDPPPVDDTTPGPRPPSGKKGAP